MGDIQSNGFEYTKVEYKNPYPEKGKPMTEKKTKRIVIAGYTRGDDDQFVIVDMPLESGTTMKTFVEFLDETEGMLTILWKE